MRVLLSEGSGLTSRQVATRLGNLGHHVEILSSTRICLTRFTRHVRKLHLVPSFASDPLAWLEAANAIATARGIDVLFPTQEQVTVLSARQSFLEVATIVPEFGSLCRVQDKISAFQTLREVGVPQPDSKVVRSSEELNQVERFPVFVKRPISTASSGVRRVSTSKELELAGAALGLDEVGLLVQTQSTGQLAMVQAVADNGRLVAHHANLRVREGVGGGASLKESVVLPMMSEHLKNLVSALRWHGALSMDVIVTADGPVVIDVNPRLVEPMNAYLSGVDLVSAMLDLARREHPPQQPTGRTGVRSRQLLLAILGAAQQRGRTAVAEELVLAFMNHGAYSDAVEELTPISGDLIAALPVFAASASTLVWPPLWRSFYAGAVGPYALTPKAWEAIFAAAVRGE